MNPITAALVLVLIHNVEYSLQEKTSLRHQRDNHQPLELRDYEVKHLSEKLSNINHLKATSEKILVPRVVGTEGHDNVRDFIIESMSSLGWNVISDKFQDNAPILGELTFENVIATLNPNADRYLLLACHYDSKYFPDEEFIGATDSAVPCAMMINLAYVLQEELNRAKNNTKLSLMFVFFDGEEAFDEWGPNDSIYGARHLAQKWKKEKFLERIDLFVLLDLIGAPDPKFYNFFENTDRWFVRLSRAEKRLAKKKLLKNYAKTTISSKSSNAYFQNLSVRTQIEDDHIPFLRAGVPILHLIPMPFPDVWHTPKDDHSIIDYTTVENINRILRIFLVEYLNISPSDENQ